GSADGGDEPGVEQARLASRLARVDLLRDFGRDRLPRVAARPPARMVAGSRRSGVVAACGEPARLHLLRNLGGRRVRRSFDRQHARPGRGELEHLARRCLFLGVRRRLYCERLDPNASAPFRTIDQRGAPMTLTHPKGPAATRSELSVLPIFELAVAHVSCHEIPRQGMPPDVAYQIIHDELLLDGNARMNLATFVTTWMEPQAEKLMAECFDKNMIDKDEYPQTAELEMRCVNMLSRLWHSPDAQQATGCSTTGSSEAAMLGGLALRRRWQKRREADGL